MILITGGAGYIGSHVNKALHSKGYETIVLDNLSYGHKESVQWGIFAEGDTGDYPYVSELFKKYPIKAVMHFSAFAYVGESVQNPQKYYSNNVSNTLKLLQAYLDTHPGQSKNFIFSSTCAVYGEPERIPIRENNPQNPVNPYGQSKWMVERILQDYGNAYGLKYSILRYFNAAGADPDGSIGEKHDPETHLIPLILEAALGKLDHIQVYGTDYPTQDGSCIRDYIHVNDLAEAHIAGLESLLNQGNNSVYNLGTGKGYSVFEIINAAKEITGTDFHVKKTSRRAGDPPSLVAEPQKIMQELGWSPKVSDIDTIIQTAWDWRRLHFFGCTDTK